MSPNPRVTPALQSIKSTLEPRCPAGAGVAGGVAGTGEPTALGTYALPPCPLGLRPRRATTSGACARAARTRSNARIVQGSASSPEAVAWEGLPRRQVPAALGTCAPHLPPPRASPSPSPPRRSQRVSKSLAARSRAPYGLHVGNHNLIFAAVLVTANSPHTGAQKIAIASTSPTYVVITFGYLRSRFAANPPSITSRYE
jgi:hypothetical protein